MDFIYFGGESHYDTEILRLT